MVPTNFVGNKLDLLPPDAHADYLVRFKSIVRTALESAGFDRAFNIRSVQLISARCGLGVEALVTVSAIDSSQECFYSRSSTHANCRRPGDATCFCWAA